MSTPVPATSPLDTAASERRPRRHSRWLREPLLHFLVLGGLLFAVDQLLVSREDDPHTIVIRPEVDEEARRTFAGSRGRQPTAAELQALRQIWLDNEVLYREGLELGVDKGDTAIRERVIFKALSLVDANLKLPPIDAAGLQAWFQAHRKRYDEPARYTFEEAVLAGDNSEATVRAFVSMLNTGTPGETNAGLRVFKDRPHENLVQSYGEAFPAALQDLPRNEWRAVRTKDAWRAVRVESITAPKPADYEDLQGVILQDWKDATAAEQRTTSVRTLAKKYEIRLEGAHR